MSKYTVLGMHLILNPLLAVLRARSFHQSLTPIAYGCYLIINKGSRQLRYIMLLYYATGGIHLPTKTSAQLQFVCSSFASSVASSQLQQRHLPPRRQV